MEAESSLHRESRVKWATFGLLYRLRSVNRGGMKRAGFSNGQTIVLYVRIGLCDAG